MTMTEEAAVRREALPISVLIVDDEQTVRDTCAAVAAQSGMKTTAVATAEEALEVLEHFAVDILLTDLKLPRANGVELLKLVHDMHPEVAVVVLTQYGTIESAVEVTRLGALDYVTKPFRIEELPAYSALARPPSTGSSSSTTWTTPSPRVHESAPSCS